MKWKKLRIRYCLLKKVPVFSERVKRKKTADAYVIELETTANRDALLEALANEGEVHFNGGFFTVTSRQLAAQDILVKLVNKKIPITYFRDITYSTKRFI